MRLTNIGLGNQALRARHRFKAQRISHSFRLNQAHIFSFGFHVDALVRERKRERGGKHEHVFVKTQFDIGHKSPFRMWRTRRPQGPLSRKVAQARFTSQKAAQNDAAANGRFAAANGEAF